MMQGFDIPTYTPETGLDYEWIDDHSISVSIGHNEIVISANRAGLLTLARFCLNLAQEAVPSGTHVHFDAGRELEEGSIDMTLERINEGAPPAVADGTNRF